MKAEGASHSAFAAVVGVDASELGNTGVWKEVTPGGPSRIHVDEFDTPWIIPRARGRRVASAPSFCISSRNRHTYPPCDRGMRRPSGWALVRRRQWLQNPCVRSTRPTYQFCSRWKYSTASSSGLSASNEAKGCFLNQVFCRFAYWRVAV